MFNNSQLSIVVYRAVNIESRTMKVNSSLSTVIRRLTESRSFAVDVSSV